MARPLPPALPLLLAAAVAASGCVEPMLRIRSEPSGIPVTMNGRPVGTTPVDVPFPHYGTVRLETPATDLDGDGWPEVRRHVALVDLSAPWYQWFPLDFFSDNLIPWTVTDVHEARLLPEVAAPPAGEGEEYEALKREAGELEVRGGKAREEAEGEAGGGAGGTAGPAKEPERE